MMDTLALPVSFVGLPDWRVIRWITDHYKVIMLWGLRWLAVSLFVTVAFSIWLTYFGHFRDRE